MSDSIAKDLVEMKQHFQQDLRQHMQAFDVALVAQQQIIDDLQQRVAHLNAAVNHQSEKDDADTV